MLYVVVLKSGISYHYEYSGDQDVSIDDVIEKFLKETAWGLVDIDKVFCAFDYETMDKDG